jgi:hypothetical protein
MTRQYKKMAGTSAVFLQADYDHASPVERDGMIWSAEELHVSQLPSEQRVMPAMANALALESLEDYDPASPGDKRHVSSLGVDFIYVDAIKGWIQMS